MRKSARLAAALISFAAVACIGTVIYSQIPIWTTPEPEVCALHSHKDDMPPFLAPALMDLATGELCELNPYLRDPDDPTRLGEMKSGFDEITLYHGALVTVLDYDESEGGAYCQVLMTEPAKPINCALYCRECRKILTRAGRKGCVLLGLHDFGTRKAWAIRNGASYIINGFSVEVDKYGVLTNQTYVENCLRVMVRLKDKNLLSSKE